MMASAPRFGKPTIFISASRDMRPEADIVARLVEDLRQDYPGLRDLQSFQWVDSDTAWRGDAPWQEQIPSPADPMVVAVVCLFGARLGEPLPADCRLPDNIALPPEVDFPWRDDMPGKIPLTGTLYEYLVARHGIESGAPGQRRAPLFVYALADAASATGNLPADQRNWGFGRHFDSVCRSHRRDELAEYFRQVDWLTVFFDRIHRPAERPCSFIDGQHDSFRRVVTHDLLRHLALDPAVSRTDALKGLKAYDIEDRAIFAGRGRFLDKIMKGIRQRPSDEPMAAIILGASGAGKSSVLRAGVAAELLHRQARDGRHYRVLLATPRQLNGPPVAAALGKMLAQSVLPELGRADDLAAVFAAPVDNATALLLDRIGEALRTASDALATEPGSGVAPGVKLVIALDQLDELVPDNPDLPPSEAAESLAGLLVAGVRQRVFWLVGSLADVRLAGWNRLLGQNAGLFELFHLGNPNWEELNEIIDISFRALGVSLPGELKENLIASCRDIDRTASATLPLLSVAMTRLGPALGRLGSVPRSPWASGAVAKGTSAMPSRVRLARLADVHAAIEELAEQAMAAAAKAAGATAPDLGPLLSQLVAVSPVASRDLVTLLPHVPSPDLRARYGPYIDELSNRRILVPATNGGVQFAHEAVIRHWGRAHRWFEAARRHLVFLEMIRPLARRWEVAAGDRRKAYLLPAGYCLDAHDLLIEWSGDPVHLPVDFLQASLIAHVAELVDHVREDGRSALAIAAQRGELALVRAYLAAGADVNRGGPGGRTALHYACDQPVCEVLLSVADLDIDARSEPGETALDRAAGQKRWDVVQALLRAGASPNGPWTSHDRTGSGIGEADGQDPADLVKSTALGEAAAAGEIEIVEALLARGAVVTGPRPTPLARACLRGHRVIVETLLAAGADPVESGRRDGETPLCSAVRGGALELVALLLDQRDACNETALSAALVAAAKAGQEAITAYLLAAGAPVDASDQVARTALAHAIARGHLATAFRLIEAGADPGWHNAAGRSLLHVAAELGDLSLVDQLASRLPTVDVLNADKSTPLHAAARANRVDVARYLMEKGADPSTRDRFGFDALACAVDTGAGDVVNMLLAQGLAPTDIGPGGLTAIEIAVARGDIETFRRLGGVARADTMPALRGQPMLVSATHTINDEMIHCLVEFGCAIDERDASDMTALMHACWVGDDAMVEALLQAGADPCATGPGGWTAPMFAAAAPGIDDDTFEGIVLELISSGADLAMLNAAGQSVREVAEIHGQGLRAAILCSLGPSMGHDFLARRDRR